MNLSFLINLLYIFIFVVILYITCNRYNYLKNVIIYTIGAGLIPGIFTFNLFSLHGFPSLLLYILYKFLIGLVVVKILTIINDRFPDGKLFLISGILLELFVAFILYKFMIAFMFALMVLFSGDLF